MTALFHILLVSLCFLPSVASPADPPQDVLVARPMSEAWGDELEAKGQYRDALHQYTAIWSQVQILARINASKDRLDPSNQEDLERLTKKVAATLRMLNPSPAVPNEAVLHAEKGASFVKHARDLRDFNDAAEQFELALSIAPWVGDYHYNLAICQKSSGQLAAALRTLRLAALLATDAKETRDIYALRGEIEAMQEIEKRRP
jgi:tetratricopeptide (TPR) repeat protein